MRYSRNCFGVILLLVISSCTANGRRGSIERSLSQNHLKQIGLALRHYHEHFGSLPPSATFDADGRALQSWRVLILPYFEEDELTKLYEQFHLNEPWDSVHNLRLAERMPYVYASGADASRGTDTTNFLVVTGDKTAFPPRRPVLMSEVTDTLDETIFIVEIGKSEIIWTQPKDIAFDENLPPSVEINAPYCNHRGVGSRHALRADFHVTMISDDMRPEVWRAKLTIQGGEQFELPHGTGGR